MTPLLDRIFPGDPDGQAAMLDELDRLREQTPTMSFPWHVFLAARAVRNAERAAAIQPHLDELAAWRRQQAKAVVL